jgi:sugar transferase (PEP-CTERM/EpsH1 system associated)
VKILWIKNGLLHPLDSGGKLRTYHMLARMRREHEVTYLAYADPAADAEALSSAAEYCTRVEWAPPPRGPAKGALAYYAKVLGSLWSRYPFTVESYTTRGMRELIRSVAAADDYDILVADFLTMCLNVPEELRLPRVHFSHNVEATIWARHARHERNPVKRLVFERECRRVAAFERFIANTYDFTITVSKRDYDHFAGTYGASRLGYVSTGVDTDYYKPMPGDEEPGSIVFLGSMDWIPNIEGVHYFVERVYPLVKSYVPNASLSIVGRSPAASIRRLAQADPSIRVTGTVSDTRPYVARAACAVVPIRVAGGTRIKIYEMMAMGKPVVSTTIGAEGLEYTAGENVLIEDDPAMFAAAVRKLLLYDRYRRGIGDKARGFVVSRCSWDSVTEAFTGLLAKAKEARRS